MNRSRPSRTIGLLTALTLVGVAACSSSDDTATDVSTAPSTSSAPVVPTTSAATTGPTTTAGSTETTAGATTTSVDTPPENDASAGGPRQLAAFASYADVALLDGATPYAGPPTPTSLDDVQILDWIRGGVERAGLGPTLERQGFAVDGTFGASFFHQVYEKYSYEYGTVFVTTDSLYNAWHLAFSKVLRDTESEVLVPALGDLLTRSLAGARAQADEFSGTELADDADRVVAFYEAAAVLLGLDIGPVSDRATEEIDLAMTAAEATTSPITGFTECQLPSSFTGCVDYTQFRPRSHYTSSETLERYFRAMSELGQQAFFVTDPASLRLGLLASRVITSDPAISALWQQIYDTTSFLVGVADDYTPVEVQTVADTVLDTGLGGADAFTDDAAVTSVGEGLVASRSVGIDPENASVRVMGARLVLDSYVLDQLAWPNVGDDEHPRTEVSPLDLASVFGSPLATQLQADSGQNDYLHYSDQLAAMRSIVDDRTGDDWAGTVYDAWLHALEPQFVERNAAFPDFMQTPAWAAKSLQTGFGSYTELKHDTLLYAKQGTAGEGEGPEPPPFTPRHWVEPDPVTFGRLAAVAGLTRDGLSSRDLLTDANAALLDSYVELATWLQGIATREIGGQVASDADNDRLSGFGSELELLWYQSSDLDQASGAVPDYQDNAALVSDIFRSSDSTLHLADGLPEELYVIVPDGSGGFQLAVGATYSYYEFWRPASEPRLTDEEWRTMLTDATQPPRPSWLAPVVVGATIADSPRVEQDG